MSTKENLMIEVAKMYYTFNMSQKDIAAQIGLSRGYVCQLLEQARQQGIVEIKVHDSASQVTDLEKYVCELFSLKKAIIVPAPANSDSRLISESVYERASTYLKSVIKSDMIIAYAWGSTIYRVSMKLSGQTEISNVTSIPLCGGTSNLQKQIYVSEISTNIATAFNGTPLFIPLPAILQNSKIKQAVYSDNNMRKVLDTIKMADIALFTVGSLPEQNVLYRGGYIDDTTMRNLMNRGAVGDFCAHFINKKGEICDEELDERTVSIDLKDFAKFRNKICVAIGSAKVESLLGVLRKKYVDVLVSDEQTIKELLNQI